MKLIHVVAAAALVTALPLALTAQERDRLQRDRLQRDRYQIDTTVSIERQGSVDLSLVSGRIRVTGWDRKDVRVTASIDEGSLKFNANPSRVTLSVDHRDGSRRRHGSLGDARFDVFVPRGTRLILEAVSGDIIASGVQGEIEAGSVSGDVSVTGAVRDVRLESVSGSVHVSQVTGNLSAESVSGDVRAEGISGNVEASTVSGTVRLLGIQTRYVRTESVSGAIIYTGNIDPAGKYDFESHSGSLRLNLPRGAGAQFEVETFSGDVDSDFAITMQPGGRKRNKGRFEFTIGDGRARVSAQTFSGRIIINDTSTDSPTRRD